MHDIKIRAGLVDVLFVEPGLETDFLAVSGRLELLGACRMDTGDHVYLLPFLLLLDGWLRLRSLFRGNIDDAHRIMNQAKDPSLRNRK